MTTFHILTRDGEFEALDASILTAHPMVKTAYIMPDSRIVRLVTYREDERYGMMEAMIDEIDRYLAMSNEQKQAYSLIQRTYPGKRDIAVVQNPALMDEARGDISRLEEQEEDGFNKYIRSLMTRQLPQLQTDCWDG